MISEEAALRKLQLAELDILFAVSVVCEKADITWWMDSGTCLGAMRHGGFIPWDDDIDIGMLRSDYDRFLEVAPALLPEGYSLHTSSNTRGFAPLFAKVFADNTRFVTKETLEADLEQGIFIDVFPYDLLYESKKKRKRQVREAATAQRMAYLYYAESITVPHKNILGALEAKACSALHHLIRTFVKDPSFFQRKFDRCVPYEEEGDLTCDVSTLVWPNMKPIPVNAIVPVIGASFEGAVLPVPKDTECYLEGMYGDWQTIPKPEERRTHLPLLLEFGDGEVWEKRGSSVSV